jgi:hypothetical protein
MESRNRSILIVAIAFIVGLILGWIVLGWWLFPVQWSGAMVQDLQPADQKMIVATAAEAYALTQDSGKAVERLQMLGSQQQVALLAAQVVQDATNSGDLVTADRVTQMANGVGLVLPAPTSPGEAAPPAPSEPAQASGSSLLPTLLGLVLLGGGIVLAAWLLLRRRPTQTAAVAPAAGTAEPSVKSTAFATSAATSERPLSTVAGPGVETAVTQEYSASFHQGDEEYDQSFDIEGSDGSYWGECGLTMSELIDGDPNRVTALEVWLFDKSDIRTVTKVLMSDFAYGNQALRDKLSSKGDAVLLSPDMGFVLDAQTLRLIGKVVALEYDDSAAPPRSTLRRLAVQLKVIRQPGQ